MPELSVGILGGSFNPLHNGHLRMAIEVRESLGLSRVDLTPLNVPPHKDVSGLLDFSLRLELVHLAVHGVCGLGVCALEGQLPVPSYSYVTLTHLRELFPHINHVFILGSTDLLTLPQWHRGLELPLVADLAVVDRLGLGAQAVEEFLHQHWPQVRSTDTGWKINDRAVHFVTMPRLDVSASMVREKFLQGRELQGLVPDAVRTSMATAPAPFVECWGSEGAPPPPQGAKAS